MSAERVVDLPHRQHPNKKDAMPVYLVCDGLVDPHKIKRIEVMRGFEPLIADVTQADGRLAEIVIPGVGGVREPEILHEIFGQQVIALDRNPRVIGEHRRRNTRLGLDHERLILGDARKMELPDSRARLVSFSSVMHEIVSAGVIDNIRESKPAGKDVIVRAQINELKRLIAPGGILAFQDVLPQLKGNGILRLNTAITKNFCERFLTYYASYFNKQGSYQRAKNGEIIEIKGSLSDLSEIWWHFRWWWVDQIRRTAPADVVRTSLAGSLGREPSKKEETALRLSRQTEGLDLFDSRLEEAAVKKIKPANALSEFREWGESYNIADGPDSLREYITELFGNEDWFIIAYKIDDSRDNELLKHHFLLYSDQEVPVPITPERLFIYARRKSPDESNQEKQDQMLGITDRIVGAEKRILP